MTSTALMPKYYLAHETPNGLRYAYPRGLIALAKSSRSWPAVESELSVSSPAGASWTLSGDWLISDAPLEELRQVTPGARVRDGFCKREELRVDGPVSPELARVFAESPERPTAEVVAHYDEHDAVHACWQCMVFVAVYGPAYKTGDPVVTTERFEGWSPLQASLPPSLGGRTWRVDDSSLAAIYGRHTLHLWPGTLSGLREAVGERLRAHPMVSKFYDWHGSRTGNFHGFSVDIVVPWETHRTRAESYRPNGDRRRKAQQRTVDEWAMRVSVMHTVPEGVRGANLEEAQARFDEVVDAQVRRFLPFGESPRACDHCGGLGWVNGDA